MDFEGQRRDRLAHEERKRLARGALESLDGTPAVAVRLLASALGLADGPVRRFGQSLSFVADWLEFPDEIDGGLATLTMAYALGRFEWDPAGTDDLIGRLEGVDAPPWPAIREALMRAARVEGAP